MNYYDVVSSYSNEVEDGVFESVTLVESVAYDEAVRHAKARVRSDRDETVYVKLAGSSDLRGVVLYVYSDPDTGSLITEEND